MTDGDSSSFGEEFMKAVRASWSLYWAPLRWLKSVLRRG